MLKHQRFPRAARSEARTHMNVGLSNNHVGMVSGHPYLEGTSFKGVFQFIICTGLGFSLDKIIPATIIYASKNTGNGMLVTQATRIESVKSAECIASFSHKRQDPSET